MSSITPKPGMKVEISMQGIEKSRLDSIEAAESLRKANEAERTDAELMRKEAEAGRITAEQERTIEEDARNLAESGRILAEKSRVTDENLRSIGEQSRVDAEKLRSIAESGRENAEQQRVESEEMRENAEASRVTAETARENAEELRQQTFEANEANRQTAYESAESARESEWTEIKSNVETSVGSAVASASAATDAANTAADNANAAAEKSVRYDVAQKISDAQKAQARGNIDAADKESVDALKGDVAAITPDDNAVDGKPWTSEKIVEALCPPFETTGSIVQCHPVEGYPLGVVSRIDATQSGTGDPSPDNIRPIVGWDSVNVTRCGKNLFDQNDTTFLAKDTRIYGASDGKALAQINTFPAGTYTLSLAEKIVSLNGIEPTETRFGLFLRATSGDKTFNISAQTELLIPTVGQIITKSVTFTLTDEYVGKFQNFYVYTGKNDYFTSPNEYTGNIYDVQIELGSTATPYEPYTGDTYNIALPETVYGGTLDLETGVVTVDWGSVDLGSLSYNKNEGGLYYANVTNIENAITVEDRRKGIVSEIYKVSSQYSMSNSIENYAMLKNNGLIFFRDDRYSTVNDLKTGITGNKLVYKLANPYTIQLTPQQITALSGVNTLYTDSGDTSVSGRTDMIWLTQSLIDRIAALETAAVSE